MIHMFRNYKHGLYQPGLLPMLPPEGREEGGAFYSMALKTKWHDRNASRLTRININNKDTCLAASGEEKQ